jgi:Flp pilus assembly protein TadG
MKRTVTLRRPQRIGRRLRHERGNIVITTALLMTIFMGMLALTVDIGFLEGQRRFMQNGADAAALAAARVMGSSVSPYSTSVSPRPAFPNFYTANDVEVRTAATNIAQQNQNAGLASRTTAFSILLQYCVASSPSAYNFTAANSDCNVSGNGWVSSPTTNGKVPDGAYKVRVTTNSTITTLFGRAARGSAQTATSANAIAFIQGICPLATVSGKVLPFTLWNQQDFGTSYSQLYELWGSTAPSPNFAGAWQNMLDLSPPRRWCDNNSAHPDYRWHFPAMIPAGVTCNYPNPSVVNSTSFTGTDNSWNNAGYSEDPRSCYTGQDESYPDLANWAAGGFNGTLVVGQKVPTYQDAQPAQGGNGGSNVAQGIYGQPSTPPCSGGQFFFSNPDGAQDHNPDFAAWGPYKDVFVFTYDNPEYWKTSNNTWTNARSGGAPDRVQLIRVLNFRIYKNYDSANSRIYGRVVSPVFPPGTSTCGTGPSFSGNVVRMGQ